MKKIFLFMLIFSISSYAEDNPSFSKVAVGVYGGINFETFSETGGAFIFEGKTNLISNLNLKLSIGYYKSISPTNYEVKSADENTIDSITFYGASSYQVTKKIYDVFPLSMGFQYIFENNLFSPYLSLDFSYNIISPSIERTGGYAWSYDSWEEIPDEFKQKYTTYYPNNSFGIVIGAGTIYHISSEIGIDLRYYYKYDSEIINTHHILVGIVF